MKSVILFLLVGLIVGCRSTPWRYRPAGPIGLVELPAPCDNALVREYIDDVDSLDVCEQYERIERAILNRESRALNVVVPSLPGATCRMSRWGISPDRDLDEDLAYGVLLCYGARMGLEAETYGLLSYWSVDESNTREITSMPDDQDRAIFLANLKDYLGCTKSAGKR